MLNDVEGTSGMLNGNLYATTTFTRLPGLLQGLDIGMQAAPVVGHVVVTVRLFDVIPG